MIMDLKEKSIWCSNGNPCENDFYRILFKELAHSVLVAGEEGCRVEFCNLDSK